jgi:hypothetical protein
MRYSIFYKTVSIIGLMLFGASLLAQGSKSRQEILNIINNTENMPKAGGAIERYFKKTFNPLDIPIIYDFVCDATIGFEMRTRLAGVAASLNPDKKQIDRITNYAIQHMPDYDNSQRDREQDLAGPIIASIPTLYKNTKDDSVLAPFRKIYEDGSCKNRCKEILISRLGPAKAEQNIEFFNKILNDPNSTVAQRKLAAQYIALMNAPENKKAFIAAPM